MDGLPQTVRDRLPDHRRAVGTEAQSGAPEFWIIGKCSGCGNEWARQGEGQSWNATCGCGGEIRPRRGDRPQTEGGIHPNVAAWGSSEALVAFRMPEPLAVSIAGVWSGISQRVREHSAHADAGWPVYEKPPTDSVGFMKWAHEEFRYGPVHRPIQLAADEVADYAALDCVDQIEREGHAVLRSPFGDLIVVDCDPAIWVARLKAGAL